MKKWILLIVVTIGLIGIGVLLMNIDKDIKEAAPIFEAVEQPMVDTQDTDWDELNYHLNPYRGVTYSDTAIEIFLISFNNENIPELHRILTLVDKYDSICLNNNLRFMTRMVDDNFDGKYSFKYEFNGVHRNGSKYSTLKICENTEPNCRFFGILFSPVDLGLKYVDIVTTIRDNFFIEVENYQQEIERTSRIYHSY